MCRYIFGNENITFVIFWAITPQTPTMMRKSAIVEPSNSFAIDPIIGQAMKTFKDNCKLVFKKYIDRRDIINTKINALQETRHELSQLQRDYCLYIFIHDDDDEKLDAYLETCRSIGEITPDSTPEQKIKYNYCRIYDYLRDQIRAIESQIGDLSCELIKLNNDIDAIIPPNFKTL